MNNLKLSENKFHSNIYTFEYYDKTCYLIPFPHKDMNLNFLIEYQYKDILYGFSLLKDTNETRINFYRKGLGIEHLYNVYLPDKRIVLPLNTIGDIYFPKVPNKNFTYLVAIPI